MSTSRTIACLALALFFSCASLYAQTGHWEGVIQAGEQKVAIEVDLALISGTSSGTFSNPAKGIRGFPLSGVRFDGSSVTFAINAGSGGGTFRGVLGANGKTMGGTFSTHGPDGQPHELPFELTRTGDAKIEAAAKMAPVRKELEGTWAGALEVDGETRELRLRFANQDGAGSGVVITREGAEITISQIEQKGSSVTLHVKMIGGSYTGTLNAGATELTGTWTQGPFTAPLTFRRSSPIDRWAAAVGGRERVAAIQSTYREATVEASGFQGVIRVWHKADGTYRKEEQIGPMSIVETFDGTNGTLQQGDAPARAMTAAELELARSQAIANWNAVFFAFFPERRRGTVTTDGDTIVLAPEGGVERRVLLDPQTSLPKTMTHRRGPQTITVTFDAYETVDGLTLEKEIHRTTGTPAFDAVIRFTKTEITWR